MCSHTLNIETKIWNNEFVNLAILLKGRSDLENLCTSGSLAIDLLIMTGKLEIRPKKISTKITKIKQWKDAFIIFSRIYLVQFPEVKFDLLKSMFLIKESAVKNPYAWMIYNGQFRMR
jgi:hypothetical protein